MKATKKNSVKEEKMKMGMIITIKKIFSKLKRNYHEEKNMGRKKGNKESIKSDVNKNKNKKRINVE